MEDTFVPEFQSNLRKHLIMMPKSISKASGIKINGKLIKSLIFTTDASIIRNTNADAVIAVYPFTPQPVITQAVMTAADIPVFCGVGGGTTQGVRVVNLALHAEFQGAMGVVVNAPTSNETVENLRNTIDIPIIVTVVDKTADIDARLRAGASIINVSCGAKTIETVTAIRKKYPNLPIIATGGPTEESCLATVIAGANAITYTPPTPGDIFKGMMEKYRNECDK